MTGRIDVASGENLAEQLRAGAPPVVTAVLTRPEAATEAALVGAVVAAVAAERAPEVRVNAVLIGDGASEADVAAATVFLAGAEAVTGQVLDIG
ncbi:hypothetical protein Q5H91_06000 [Sphingomonas sp. KR1UV-12]|uniref:Short chain dehydrogenase-like proteobacteria domain-containing protein n=1 Tax=Sphingomonas aurea TaxID=3063994 RepID=A0ABT9EIG7_9SPHN|nr:hypothetical protein [Sphingomonas sp. KR1UV-12]MDP1026756.1 hypothetical protein [Sphingomonas sp. KR1UV-12]